MTRYPWGSSCAGCSSTDAVWSLWGTSLEPTVTWATWTTESVSERRRYFQEKLHLSTNLRALRTCALRHCCHSWHTYTWVFQSISRFDIELDRQWDIWNDELKDELKKRWMYNLCLRLLGVVYLLFLVSNTQSSHNLSYPVGAQSPLAPWKQKICPHHFY